MSFHVHETPLFVCVLYCFGMVGNMNPWNGGKRNVTTTKSVSVENKKLKFRSEPSIAKIKKICILKEKN